MIFPTLPAINYEPTSVQVAVDIRDEQKGYSSLKKEGEGSTTVKPLGIESSDEKEERNNKGSQSSTPTFINLDSDKGNGGNSILEAAQTEDYFRTTTYSPAYLKHSTAVAISQIKNLVDEWNRKGTNDSTSEISQIKTILDEYAQYFVQRPESEVLLGGLETIFDGDRWESLDSAKLSLISEQLENFQAGNVRWESLKRFAREIWSAEIA